MRIGAAGVALVAVLGCAAPEAVRPPSRTLFQETFDTAPDAGWRFAGHSPDDWAVAGGRLEIGTPAAPAALYENAGLILLADLDNYSVVTLEALPGRRDPPTVLRVFSEIDGVLEDDSVVAYQPGVPVRLRMRIDRSTVTGFYRREGSGDWLVIGTSRRPAATSFKVGMQAGYGGSEAGRRAEFDNFEIAVDCPARELDGVVRERPGESRVDSRFELGAHAWRTFATSASSPTSTTASRPLPIG